MNCARCKQNSYRSERVRVQAAVALALLHARLTTAAYAGAGTDGWSANARGTSWKFIDRTPEPRSGIVSLVLKDRGANAPGRVRLKLKGRGGVYPVFPGDEPLTATIVFRDGSVGECAETAFVASDCSFTGAGTRIGCSK
jgi:hypothetical protein